jgi:hypothetical protein
LGLQFQLWMICLRGESASEKADVWGAGLCGYLMLKGKLPLKFRG